MKNSGENFNLKNRILLKIQFIETSNSDFIYNYKKLEKDIQQNLNELFNNFIKEDKYLIFSLINYIKNNSLYYCLEIKNEVNKKDLFCYYKKFN